MFYKIKVNKNNLEVISKVKRAKIDDGFLYLTQDEIEQLNPDAVIGYHPNENDINKKIV